MESATVEKAATESPQGARPWPTCFRSRSASTARTGQSCTRTPPASGSAKTYEEVGEIVKALSLGLMDLGIEKGDKVSILANTRPEWTYYDFAALSAGATVVPIYQTNSPEECQYVLENSDAVAVIVEDEEQLAKVRQVRDACPKLEHVILMEGTADDAISMDDLAARGEGTSDADWEARWSSVTPRRHLHLHLHLGHHRPAEGLRDLARQLPLDAGHGPRGERAGRRGADLPVPAAGAQLRAADPARHLRPRGDPGLLGARPAQDHPQPDRGEADLLPVGPPHLREDLHRRDRQHREGGGPEEGRLQLGRRRRQEGSRARARRQADRLAAAQAVRVRRQAGPVQDPGAVRRQPEARRHRRGADQSRDPALLRRRGRAGRRGLGHDRDIDRGDDLAPGGVQVRDRRASRSTHARSRSPTTARSWSRARTSSRATTRTKRRPRRRSSTAGCTPATSASSIPTAT